MTFFDPVFLKPVASSIFKGVHLSRSKGREPAKGCSFLSAKNSKKLHSLKLTYRLKNDGLDIVILFGQTVSFREGNQQKSPSYSGDCSSSSPSPIAPDLESTSAAGK